MVGPNPTIKFLCSYGGKILPRYPDGKLRYQGGETRVLAVDRSIPFSEVSSKMGEMCGTAVSVRCQLPTEDLDALVSITCDEDLANLIEEYDRVAAASSSPSPSCLKIRAFLSMPKSSTTNKKPVSPSSSSSASSSNSNSKSSSSSTPRFSGPCIQRQISGPPAPVAFPLYSGKGKSPMITPSPYYGTYHHVHHANPAATATATATATHPYSRSHIYLIHNGNHWQ